MNCRLIAVALAAVAVFAPAAFAQNASASASPKVGVVDLDAVAKAVGREALIRQQLERATQQLNQQLVNAANEMKQALEAEQKKLGEAPAEEDQRRLRVMLAQANQNVQNNQTLAQMRVNQLKNELIVHFRNEVRPLTEKAAKEAGAAVVLVASENNVLWFDPALDLTDEVIAAYRANPPKATTPPTTPAPQNDKPTLDDAK